MVAMLILDGVRYRLVPEDEYDRLVSRQTAEQEADLPPLPEPGPDGLVPAVEYMDASLARKLIRARRRIGLSQADLARRAGIRIETLNRIEKLKVTPSVATIDKIDRALKAAEAATSPKQPTKRGRPAKARKPLR